MANTATPTLNAVQAATGTSTTQLMAGLPTPMTVNFDKTLTALVMATLEENSRRALKWLAPEDVRLGNLIPGTNLVRYIAYGDLPVVASTLVGDYEVKVEGVPNESTGFSIGYAEFGVKQYMKTIRLTDVAMDMSPHDLMSIAAERAAFNALAVMDAIAANVVMPTGDTLTASFPAGTYGAEGVANQAAITATGVLNGDEVKRAVARLKSQEIAPYSDGFYRAHVHPNATFDLMSDTSVGGWIEASKYAATTQLLDGEVGRYAGVRFIETTVNTWRTANIYQSLFHGPDYFAWGDLQSTRAYLVRPGGDHYDPAAQSAIVAWKGMWGGSILTLTAYTGIKAHRLVHSGVLTGTDPVNRG